MEQKTIRQKLLNILDDTNDNYIGAETALEQVLCLIDELLPSEEEIKHVANGYDNEMSSIAESILVPQGFINGADYVINHIKNKLK